MTGGRSESSISRPRSPYDSGRIGRRPHKLGPLIDNTLETLFGWRIPTSDNLSTSSLNEVSDGKQRYPERFATESW